MNWLGIAAVSSGMGALAGTCFVHAHVIMGSVAMVLFAAWIAAYIKRSRILSGLTFLGAGAALLAMYIGINVYIALGAVTLIILGWEAGLSAREIAPFPKQAQHAFTRIRLPVLCAMAGIGLGIGSGVLGVHLHLRFGTALALSVLALALLSALLLMVVPHSGHGDYR